ncbi:MAG: TatD family hydrolase [Phycisphaerae bacterium]
MTEPAIDTHAHVHFDRLAEDMPGVLERARAAGVERIINVGTGPAENPRVVELAEREPLIYAAVGFHPHEAAKVKAVDWPILEELAAREKVVALGEFGLDYHYEHSPRAVQREVFAEAVRLALRLDMPLVIHTREAEADTLAVLDAAAEGQMPCGVFHCFTGSADYAKEALARGFYVSFSGVVTFPNAREVQEAARVVPPERLLVETDAPYCAPVPMRGKRNEPAYVVHVIRFLAGLYDLSEDDVRRITMRNATHLFGLPLERGGPCFVYAIRRSLYVNLTNECSNLCTFCPRSGGELLVKGHDLRLKREPTPGDILKALKEAALERYEEVVFCGFGEPTLRLDAIKKVAKAVRDRWRLPVRLDTNGQGSLLAGRDIVPELAEVVDAVSVSLNAPDAATYECLCRPTLPDAFAMVCSFLRRAKEMIPKVTATAVAVPGLDLDAVRRLAEEDLGIALHVRAYNVVG